MSTTVRKVGATEAESLAGVLVRAFQDDPVLRWFCPDPAKRAHRATRFFRELVLEGPIGELGETYRTPDGEAVAVWAPPGRWRVSLGKQLRLLPKIVSIVSLRLTPSRLRGFNMIEAAHPKDPPHWYLQTIGTDPSHQGSGFGSALLANMLARCDADGLPAYLEASTEANVPFYRRHGFEVTRRIDLRDGPSLWLMWREPRSPDSAD